MTGNPILELEGVAIAAGDDVICRDIGLTVNEGERHILIGPNGSGKSSLLCGLMGVRPFRIVAGTATLLGRDLADMSIDERARAGIGMAFQRPPSLTGVTARRSCSRGRGCRIWWCRRRTTGGWCRSGRGAVCRR